MSSVSRLGRCVLVVEDDPDIRDTVADVLEEEGYSVMSAKHGAEGLACLNDAKQLPAIIILDLMMPVMDGIAFREAQRKNPAWTSIPVLVLSADRTSREKAEAMGARGYLQKPFDINHLLDLLREIEKSPNAPMNSR
jgi:two-component system chemotaxis response regulator CheY